jgi:hypothetical protein
MRLDLGIDMKINKTDLEEVGYEGMKWLYLAQDTAPWRDLLNTVMNLRVP